MNKKSNDNIQTHSHFRDPSAPVVRVRNLTKSFGGVTVLDGISFDVYPGEMLVIMGGSGCGKSTCLRCIIGSIQPDSGLVELFGQDISKLEENQLDEIRKRFGVLFQSGALFNSMTVGDNVALPMVEHTDLDPQTIEIMVKIKLEQVGLRSAQHRMPSEISGGMKKRAGLARSISLDPEILFYDEPSAGLDPVTSAEIDQLMLNLAKKMDVASVVVTHEMDSAFRIADRMIMLDQGKVLMEGSRDEFEKIRDSKPTGDETEDHIRQFLQGDSDGPITHRRRTGDFREDLLSVAAERKTKRHWY